MSKLGKKPLSYFRDLRTKDLEYESQPDSRVLKVKTETGEEIRLLHLQSFAPLTASEGFDVESGKEIRSMLGDYFIYYESPALLGVRDFNDRNSSIVSDLGERTKDCNVYLTMDMLDTQLFPRKAVEQFYLLQAADISTLAYPIPGAIVGAGLSRVSQQLAAVAGVYHIPMVSPGSTSISLDNKFAAPSFARTIPTNEADARASVFYLKDYLHVTHVGLIFVKGEYGESFRQAFVSATTDAGLKLVAASYEENNEKSLLDSLGFLKATGYRYFLSVSQISYFDVVLEKAFDVGLVGPEYVWFLPATEVIAENGYKVPKNRPGLAEAIRGSAVVSVNTQLSENFTREIHRSITSDKVFQDFYISSHPESFIFDNYNLSNSVSTLSPYSYPSYDAAIALGLAACEAEKEFFTGEEHHKRLLNISFTGASGVIGLDPNTGTRRYDTLRYRVTNILQVEDTSDTDNFIFRPQLAAIIDFNEKTPVSEASSFIFNSRSTDIPLALPLLDEDLNLIPDFIRAIGWFLAVVVLGMSAFFATWTYRRRRHHRVLASQPFYLVLMCLGTALMSTAIIPMSLQDPIPQGILDGSCMTTIWLFVLGFAFAFGSLACKLIRVSRIFHAALEMNHVEITALDAAWPMCSLILTDVIVLSIWTRISPLQYERIEFDTFDNFGRPSSSYGYCKDSSKGSIIFGTILGLLNFLAVVLCNYKAYGARNIPSNFSESSFIALSNFFLLEGILIFAPILVLVTDNPAADFLIRALLITFICFVILLPIFLPKVFPPSQQANPSKTRRRSFTQGVSRIESETGGGSLKIIRPEYINATDQLHEFITKARTKSKVRFSDSGGNTNFHASLRESKFSIKESRLRERLRTSREDQESGLFDAPNASLGSTVSELRANIRQREESAVSCQRGNHESGQQLDKSVSNLGSSVSELKANIRRKEASKNVKA